MSIATKNAVQGLAAQDLGLGDQLREQLSASQDDMKKKKQLQMAAAKMGGSALGPGTMSLYGDAGGFSV